MSPSMSRKMAVAVSLTSVGLVAGIGSAIVWLLFAQLYAPTCPHFGLEEPLAVCRRPVLFIGGSLALAAACGVFLFTVAARRLASRF